MAKTFTNLSQLTKAILKKDEPQKQHQKPAQAHTAIPHPQKVASVPVVAAEEPQLSRAEADCLAYFSHTSLTDPRYATAGRAKTPTPPKGGAGAKSPSVPTPDPAVAALEAETTHLASEVEDLRRALAAAETRATAAEQALEAQRAAAKSGDEQRARLEAEIRALREKAAEAPHVAVSSESAPSAQPPAPVQASSGIHLSTSTSSLHLKSPRGFVEMFPGEVREMVIAALADAQATAAQSTRERRAAVLEAVLAVNPSSGELERRRAELRQILKDASYSHDEHTIRAVEKLGMKLISGKKHWKLEYGNVRMPMSKTPSDWRANLNSSADMANRCF